MSALWGHFTPLAESRDAALDSTRVIERGQGCYVWDDRGNRYLDGLSSLFTTMVGHGRQALADAAAEQMRRLAYFPVWSYAHPTALALAERLAALAPGDLNRVFFTTGGSEAVESAWKLARQYHAARGEPWRYKVIGRSLAYHGTSMGALAITGLPSIKAPFEPLVPGGLTVANTNRYRCGLCASAPACTLGCADDIEAAILRAGPETVAAVFIEPVQNAGGAFVPPPGYLTRVREICDRHGALLVSDEVIAAFGRFGALFACERFGYQPDIVTFAKGVTSGYAPLGGMVVSDRVAEPFVTTGEMFLHGFTFAGHPVSCAVAMANLDILEGEDLPGRVLANEGAFRATLERLGDLPIVGDIRGTGYFYALELVRDPATRATFSPAEADHLLRAIISNRLLDLGLICRADDRGDPVITLAPPLVAGEEEFDMIERVLRQVLVEAQAEMGVR
jgi:hypothetical protein